MDPDKRRFFVIGYPRSRTAWLSVLLDGDGVRCRHEASMDEVEEWPDEIAGTCNSGLLFRVRECMERFPDARWVLINRDPQDALSSIMAEWPHQAGEWLAKWPKFEGAAFAAGGVLPDETLFVDYTDIDRRAWEIYEHCTGKSMRPGKAHMLRGLKITQIPPAQSFPETAALHSAIEQISAKGFDLRGLSVRPFNRSRDSLLLTEWSEGHGTEGTAAMLPLLPPLGVVVEDDAGPAGMLFCRESYGVPAADLEFCVSRPGMTLAQASNVMAFAAAACIELAGKLVLPEAHYSVFRVTCRPSLGRFMERLGFIPHGPDSCQKYIYQKS